MQNVEQSRWFPAFLVEAHTPHQGLFFLEKDSKKKTPVPTAENISVKIWKRQKILDCI